MGPQEPCIQRLLCKNFKPKNLLPIEVFRGRFPALLFFMMIHLNASETVGIDIEHIINGTPPDRPSE